METLLRVTGGIEGVRVIDPINLFCTEAACRPHEGRTLYFSDSNHLSAAGMDRFYKTYESDFLWALSGHGTDNTSRIGQISNHKSLPSFGQQ